MLIEKELYDKASDITMTDYVEIIYNPGSKFAHISEFAAQSIIADLIHEIDILNEKIEDLEQDIENNYKPITKEEETGINYRDFI